MDTNEVELELPARRVTVIGPAQEHTSHSTVHCALKGDAQDVERCRSCSRLIREEAQALICSFPADALGAKGLCGEVLPRESLALDVELPADEARRLLERAGLSSAPVVDDNRMLLGVTSVEALAALASDADGQVEDAIHPTHAVNQRLGILELAAVVDERRLDRIPVVDDESHLLGVISALDVVRWFSKRTRVALLTERLTATPPWPSP
jgi:CBS domain-containing protein